MASIDDVNTPGEHIWNFSRFRPGVGGREWLQLALWAPVGTVLCMLRVVAWPLGMLGYPIAIALGRGEGYMRVSQVLWGVSVTVSGLENLHSSEAPVVAANHQSDFDACAIWAANPPAEQRLVVVDHWRPVIWVAQKLGWPVNPIYTSQGASKELLRNEITTRTWAPSGKLRRLLLFPEGRTTSGNTIMPFFDFAFSLGAPVVPCAVKLINRWPMNMQMNGCSVLCNLAALFFLPYVNFEVTFLPEITGEGLSKEDFAEAVRSSLLSHLDLLPTTLTAKDKVAYGKSRRERLKEK